MLFFLAGNGDWERGDCSARLRLGTDDFDVWSWDENWMPLEEEERRNRLDKDEDKDKDSMTQNETIDTKVEHETDPKDANNNGDRSLVRTYERGDFVMRPKGGRDLEMEQVKKWHQ